MSTLDSLPTIAKFYGVSEKTADRWLDEPSAPAPKINKFRNRKWDRYEVREWILTHCERSGTYGKWRLIRVERRTVEA